MNIRSLMGAVVGLAVAVIATDSPATTVTKTYDFNASPVTVTPNDDTDELIINVEFGESFSAFGNFTFSGEYSVDVANPRYVWALGVGADPCCISGRGGSVNDFGPRSSFSRSIGSSVSLSGQPSFLSTLLSGAFTWAMDPTNAGPISMPIAPLPPALTITRVTFTYANAQIVALPPSAWLFLTGFGLVGAATLRRRAAQCAQ